MRLRKTASAKDRIFISYRRSDTRGYAGRLEDTLKAYFGKDRVFRDVGGITPGEDFMNKIDESIEGAGALIVLIGPNWLVKNDDGKPRLQDPGDYVAGEIEAALVRKRPIFPVLVDGASMPREEDLPDRLKDLIRSNAVTISDERWDFDVTRLAKVLAFDVSGSVNERRLDRLKLGVLLLLLVSMVFTSLMFARAAFSTACTMEKLLYPGYSSAGKGERANMSWIKRVLVATNRCEEVKALTAANVAEKTVTRDAVAQKAFTAGNAAVNFVCILVTTLLLAAARTWVEQSRRKFIWAAVVLGALGTLCSFIFYVATNQENPVGAHTAMFTASSIIITGMLVLMGLSGFKPTDSVG